jgi:UDP-N-acetylglucosamine--N-acetylmuramyl-(pentapeptide) pyrophosphoryl-undecaprenol N-acetylglucosamine transferase
VTKQVKHVVVAGGGTGGHLFPGVAVVEALEELLGDGVRVSFVGSDRGIEARKVPQLGYELHTVDVAPLKAGGVSGLLKGLAKLPGAGAKTLSLVRKLSPDLVIAVGGYAAGPFTMSAAVSGVPTVLMEQNAVPGLTNKLLSRVAKKAYVSFESTCDHLDGPECLFVGNPVRSSIRQRRDFQYEAPAANGPFHILVIGGSGGAGSLNAGVPVALRALPEDLQKRIQITHQAGRGRTDEVDFEGFLGEASVVEFIDDMAAAYGALDLLICRAGMSTIAEVTVMGLPALYVPLSLGDAHQTENAREIVEAGGGMMVSDDEIGASRSTRLIQGVMQNPQSLANLARRSKQLGHPDAAEHVARDVIDAFLS